MKPKIATLLEQCIENGIRHGYYRAHKHNPTPSQEDIFEALEHAIMGEIYEWFDFDESDESTI